MSGTYRPTRTFSIALWSPRVGVDNIFSHFWEFVYIRPQLIIPLSIFNFHFAIIVIPLFLLLSPGLKAKMGLSHIAFLAVVSLGSSSAVIPRHESISFAGPLEVEAAGIANIHITYNLPISGPLSLHYGSCVSSADLTPDQRHHLIGRTAVGDHPFARRHVEHPSQRPTRFVWVVPADAPSNGCLNAYSGSDLLGVSSPISIKSRKSRREMLTKRDNVAFADVCSFQKLICSTLMRLRLQMLRGHGSTASNI